MPRLILHGSSYRRRNNRRRRWIANLVCHSKQTTAELDFIDFIADGDCEELERLLKRLQAANKFVLRLTVRRLGSFYQECSPAIWAVDCRQWHLLPVLWKYGYDVNRPQFCRRWTRFCGRQTRPNNPPYRHTWTKGQYTYQSILDYFFASVYEEVGGNLDEEETPLYEEPENFTNPLRTVLSRTSNLLEHGINVHRIDSIIIFNSLAASFDRYMCRFFDFTERLFPDVPKCREGFIELEVLQMLIENGFSEFECMDYVSPNTNWLGILICLLSHPQMRNITEGGFRVPPILQCASLLLVNIIVWRFFHPSSEAELRDSVNNLRLRKTYMRRYSDDRDYFSQRMAVVIEDCENTLRSPPSLGLLARNKIRRLLGGSNFRQKLASLNLPSSLTNFVSYINVEHLRWIHAPPLISTLATGKSNHVYVNHEERVDVDETPASPKGVLRQPLGAASPIRDHVPPPPQSAVQSGGTRVISIKRRASACSSRMSRFQPLPVLRMQRSKTALVRRPRPSSAPLPKMPPTAFVRLSQQTVW